MPSSFELDFVVFAVATAGLAIGGLWWSARQGLLRRGTWLALLLLVGFVAAAWLQLQRVTRRETNRYSDSMEILANTYAAEFQHLGHALLPDFPSEQDAKYQQLLQCQVRWLKANPQINDIYTFRRNAAGEVVLLVDSETDYDHSGTIEGDTEQRTRPGEVYTSVDASLLSAFAGRGAFTPQPHQDRWGSWFSYYIPLRDAQGQVEGVLGIDTASEELLQTLFRARVSTLSQFALLVLGVLTLAGAAGAGMLSKINEESQMMAASVAQEKQRFEKLVHAVDGIVWESTADPCSFSYVSPTAEKMLGFALEKWTATPDFWLSRVHSEDLSRVTELRERHMKLSSPYQLEYRLLHADGHIVWVKERGLVAGKDDKRTLRGVITDISPAQKSALELDQTHRKLLETSRQAGMAEVATGVLHNVGNVLNSVNISSSILVEEMRQTQLPTLRKVATLLQGQPDLGAFLTKDPRGLAVPGFLLELSTRLEQEQSRVYTELEALCNNVEHVKDVVAMQQSYAKRGGSQESVDVREVVEDAIAIVQASIVRHGVELVREYQAVQPIFGERNRILQILVNLLRNAKHAVSEPGQSTRTVFIEIHPAASDFVEIAVRDTGVGISSEHMRKLFSYGFTTKPEGHGFGLHTSVNTAREMGGELTASSEGPQCGARFSLRLPAAAQPQPTLLGTSTQLAKESPRWSKTIPIPLVLPS
jgi:signal transduction histidine kinase